MASRSQQNDNTSSSLKKIHLEPIPVYRPKVQDLLVERASEQELRRVFDKYATHTIFNQKAIKSEELIQKYLGLMADKNYNEESLKILANAVDLNKDGYVSFDEFRLFEELLCSPDVLFKCAFQLFDTRGTGLISFDNFKSIINSTKIVKEIPFNFESEFISNTFGKKRDRQINYQEFSQLIHDFHEEHAIQAFHKFDSANQGYILPSHFKTILLELKGYLLSPYIKENLDNLLAQSQVITFPYFNAFIHLLKNMELIKKVYLTCSNESPVKEVSKGQFLREAQQFSELTPYEVHILFSIIKNFHAKDDAITLKDLEKISPLDEKLMPYRVTAKKAQDTINFQNRNVFVQILESVYRFGLGSIAGAIGAFAVYPIDLVKTRMQNQRSKSYVGEVMYRNSWDCFKKVIRHEGVLGLYKGLTVQLIGVAPEKAIKLMVNDLVRDKIMQYNGSLPLYGEILAGGCAGGCQVIFTNPMEIVKIRMQVAGEINRSMAKSERTMMIVKELGFFGLYKGVRACLLRDIPFSMIYFPSYSHMKKKLADENGHNSPMSLFYSGLIAGVPAAGLCTPADVIKTRIQVRERAGQTQYNGVVDAAVKIYREEGASAFWKGSGARVFRSSPQFGVTLLAYELLQRMLYVDFGGRKPEGSQIEVAASTTSSIESLNPDHVGGYKLGGVTFAGLENKFGLSFPKYRAVSGSN